MASSISNKTTKNQTLAYASKLRSSELSSNGQRQAAAYPRLHPKESIGLAAFLGSPIAGGILLAHNLIKTTRVSQAVMVLLGTVAVTGIMIAIGISLPEGVRLGIIGPIFAAIGLKAIAEKLLRQNTNESKKTSWNVTASGSASALDYWQLLS